MTVNKRKTLKLLKNKENTAFNSVSINHFRFSESTVQLFILTAKKKFKKKGKFKFFFLVKTNGFSDLFFSIVLTSVD